MSTRMIGTSIDDLPKVYCDLVHLHPPRPIHDEMELANAHEVVEQLAGFDLNEDQSDYLEAISTFIEKYEDEHIDIPRAGISPLGVLKFLLDEHGMSATDLGDLLGQTSLGVDILKGERELTLTHIRQLAQHFSLDPSVFIG